MASTGRHLEVPSFRVLGKIAAVAAGESTHGPGDQSQARPGPAPAQVSGDGGGADASGRRRCLPIRWGAGMRAQREPGPPEGSAGSRRESRDPDAAASPGVAAAAAVLSAPRKWPKGSGRDPLRDSPAPLAPRPPPPRCSRGLGEGGGRESGTGETGRTGRTGGRGRGWGPERDSGASLRMWPRPPRRLSGVPDLTSAARPGARGPAFPGLGVVPSQSLPSGIPEGAGAEPPHSGDASGPGWPEPASPSRPDASCPLREAGPPAHAGGFSPAGRVWPRRPSPGAPPQGRPVLGLRPTPPPHCPGVALV